MKVPCTIIVLFISAYLSESAHANNRSKRQLGGYRFPGPRLSDDYASASRNLVKREPQYEDEYSPRPSAGGSQSGYRSPPASAYQPELNDYPSRPYAPAASSSSYPRDNKRSNYASGPSSEASPKKDEDEPEEERKPSKLELLLAQSKFACSEKKDGYYADTGLGCQVFHYCVQGVKHSWMCPDQTVFHQVHLNCVPAAQDICAQSEKFFVVNDYLHKEYDQRGPNNTIRYHQRYYPEEFLGDAALNLPQSFGFPPEQSAPAARSQQSAAYSQPKPRPTYSDEADQDTAIPYSNNYRPQSQSYPPAASRDQSSSLPYRTSSSSSRPSSYPSQPTYSPTTQRRPAAESSPSSYPASYPSYPSYTTSAPTAYRPVSSSGLRYAQSSGSPAVRSYPVTAARATASPYSSYQTATYPTQSRPTPATSYNSSPVYKKVPAASVPRYPYTSSYPSLTSSASSSAHDTAYSPISPAYDSGYSRYNSAFAGSDYPSRFRTGVTYESDY